MRPFSSRFLQSVAAAVLGAAATAAIVGGYAVTHADDSSVAIHACVAQKDGAVRIVGSPTECDTKKETSTEWNKEGRPGQPGVPGQPGTPGVQGPEGAIASLDDMNGIGCTVGDQAGTVRVTVMANETIVLKCNQTPVDQDGDGYVSPGEDCQDEDSTVHPGAVEELNKQDDDCDFEIDEGFAPVLVAVPTTQLVPVGENSSPTFVNVAVRNDGNAAALSLGVILTSNDKGLYTIVGNTCGVVLAPSATCSVTVRYTGHYGLLPPFDPDELGNGMLTWTASNNQGDAVSAFTFLDGTP